MPFVPVLKTTIEVRPDPFQSLLPSPIWYHYWVDEGHPPAYAVDGTRLLRTANGLPTASACADKSGESLAARSPDTRADDVESLLPTATACAFSAPIRREL